MGEIQLAQHNDSRDAASFIGHCAVPMLTAPRRTVKWQKSPLRKWSEGHENGQDWNQMR